MKISKKTALLILAYCFMGLYVISRNQVAGVTYFTVFPFHIYLLVKALKRNQIIFGVFFLVIFFSHGIHSFTFFLFPENYAPTGFGAIGNFDYSLTYFFKAYVYVFVFMLGVYAVSSIVYATKTAVQCDVFKAMYNSVNQRMYGIKRSAMYDYLTILVCIFGCLLAVFMYSNSIGINGITPKRLPFHLTGIIYYFRKYVLVALILLCYLKSKKRRGAFWAICFYAIFGGMAFASRGVVVFVLFPVVAIDIVSRKKGRVLFSIFYFLFLYHFLSTAKAILYLSSTLDTPLLSYMWKVITSYDPSTFDLLGTINGFSSRLFGLQETILTYQHANGTVLDLVQFYFGKSIGAIVPDMATSMFGLQFSSNFSFGVAIGYIASALFLSGGSLVLMFLQGIFMGWIFSIHEKCINRSIKENSNIMRMWIVIGVSLLGLATVWLTTSLMALYFATAFNLIFTKLKLQIMAFGRKKEIGSYVL